MVRLDDTSDEEFPRTEPVDATGSRNDGGEAPVADRPVVGGDREGGAPLDAEGESAVTAGADRERDDRDDVDPIDACDDDAPSAAAGDLGEPNDAPVVEGPRDDVEPIDASFDDLAEAGLATVEDADDDAFDQDTDVQSIVDDPAALADAEAEADTDEESAELAPEADADVAVPEVDQLTADADAPDPETRAEPVMAKAPTVGLEGDEEEVPELTESGELSRVLLAVLLSTREPLKRVRLAEICNSTQKAVDAALERLTSDLEASGFPLTIVETGDAPRLMTQPAVFPYLRRMRKTRKAEKLSPAALETLAVIAYRQPVIRAEVEAIRGVKVGPMLKSLLDHKLVKVTGRADVPGRPLQYGTTQVFLERFGLRSLKDLPSVQEFKTLG